MKCKSKNDVFWGNAVIYSEKELKEKRIKYDAKVKLMVTRWAVINHVLDNLEISKRDIKFRIMNMLLFIPTRHGISINSKCVQNEQNLLRTRNHTWIADKLVS